MAELGGVEIRQLRYFLAVAEEGSVTRAANRLHLAQPSLSQQILGLERRLGVQLFHRRQHGVELTPAGEALLDGTRRAFAHLESAITAARGTPRTLAVGICVGLSADLLGRVRSALASALGEAAELEFSTVDSQAQPGRLRGGALAFGVLRLPADARGLVLAPVSDEPLCVVLHRSHPLVERTTLSWSDLRDQDLLWFEQGRAPGYAALVLAQLNAQSWYPDLRRSGHGRHALFVQALRDGGNVVALRPASAVHDEELVCRSIDGADVPRERLALAAHADTPQADIVHTVGEALRAEA